MDRYSSYIQKLKQTAPKADFDSLYHKIEEKRGRRVRTIFIRPLIGLAVVAMLLLLALPILTYKNSNITENNNLTAYVFQNDRAGDYVMADFILGD